MIFLTDGKNIYFTYVEDIRAINLIDGKEEWILSLHNERGAFNDELKALFLNYV